MTLHEKRCIRCRHFIPKMINYFGGTQPFCRNPKIIETQKNQPETGGQISPTEWKVEDHRMMSSNSYFRPMTEYQVEQISVLGCCSEEDTCSDVKQAE